MDWALVSCDVDPVSHQHKQHTSFNELRKSFYGCSIFTTRVTSTDWSSERYRLLIAIQSVAMKPTILIIILWLDTR